MQKILHFLKKTKDAYFALPLQKVLLVWVSMFLSILLLLIGLIIVNEKLVITIPKRGGTLVEGIIGTPRFINPILATSDEDEALSSLIFAGLTKLDEKNSTVLDMASQIQKSNDSLSYTVTLKDGLLFHDGKKVTAEDVIFTISLIQNPLIKSPLKIKWEGVRVEQLSDLKILFTLKQPYPLFERSLSVGILPKHIWKNLSQEEIALSDQNINAVGSGPYSIEKIEQDSGIPRVFHLKENKFYSLGRPFISSIIIRSYKNEKLLTQAFLSKEINAYTVSSSLTSKEIDTKGLVVNSMILPQTYSIFLNPNKSSFLVDKDIRRALLLALEKETLVESIFGDTAIVAKTQFPFEENDIPAVANEDPKTLIEMSNYRKKNATSTLAITLTIGDSEENRRLASLIKDKWVALGVQTDIEIFEFSDLNQKIIKNRDFQAVLSGTLVENVSDLYAFWHSSQRAFPGLNITNFASSKMDKNLESLRTEEDDARRTELVKEIEEELSYETPAIFLYHPKLIYIARAPLTTSFPVYGISEGARFVAIEKWYRQTEQVWKYSYNKTFIDSLEKILH
jgi:peptide/nickel transport system substrate-binding protein